MHRRLHCDRSARGRGDREGCYASDEIVDLSWDDGGPYDGDLQRRRRSGSNPIPGPNPDQDLPQAGGGAGIGLDVVAEGLTSPVALVAAPDSSGRLFIVDQIGTIRVVAPDGTLRTSRFSTCVI